MHRPAVAVFFSEHSREGSVDTCNIYKGRCPRSHKAFNAHVRDCARIANCEGSIKANPSEIFMAIEDTPDDKLSSNTAEDNIAEIEIGEAHPPDCTCDECI